MHTSAFHLFLDRHVHKSFSVLHCFCCGLPKTFFMKKYLIASFFIAFAVCAYAQNDTSGRRPDTTGRNPDTSSFRRTTTSNNAAKSHMDSLRRDSTGVYNNRDDMNNMNNMNRYDSTRNNNWQNKRDSAGMNDANRMMNRNKNAYGNRRDTTNTSMPVKTKTKIKDPNGPDKKTKTKKDPNTSGSDQ
jgi:hypothetical protein